MEKILSEIEKNTRPLPQIPLEVKYNTNYHRMNLTDSIDLSDGNYVIGVTSFNTYNSIFNVTSKNNRFIYYDSVMGMKEIILLPGAYEIDQINAEISRQIMNESILSESPITIEADTSTLRSIIRLKDSFSVDFTFSNTLRDLLGFNSRVLTDPVNISDKKVNITDIHRIHLCCDCIVGSLRNGEPSNILFSLILSEPPGAKIVRQPNLILYKHIYKEKLDYIEFWMEDDDRNKIDNHGETVGLTLHMKKNS